MIFIAIGANLASADGAAPQQTCRRAAAALDGAAGLRLAAVSRWYETAPVPPSDQPHYINGVAMLHGQVEPLVLLAVLQQMEQAAGRVRGEANAARVLDLDIVAMDSLAVDEPGLTIPHPRMHERAFVLRPLLDVAPGWWHPVLHRPAAGLLAALPSQGVCALAISRPED